MAREDNQMVQQLEEQMTRINERLRGRERRGGGWLGLFGGIGLGAAIGGTLAYLLRSREEDEPYIPPAPAPARRTDDAVLLRGSASIATPAPQEAQADDEPIVLKTASPAPAPASDVEPVVAEAAAPAATDEVSEETTAPAAEETSAQVAPNTAGEAAPAAAAVEVSPGASAAGTATKTGEATAEGETSEKPSYLNSAEPIDENTCPASHPIKGNVNRTGELIFHVPGSNNYERTNPEACFASEEDAEAAGFRKARS